MKRGDLKIDRRTAIHCPTEELARKVIDIAHNLGYKTYYDNSYLSLPKSTWYKYKSSTCYCLYWGMIENLKNIDESYTIMSAKDFIALHESDKKIYYRGDLKKGSQIIKALENLGGINKQKLTGNGTDNLYFINNKNVIDATQSNELSGWLLQQAFTKAFLPELPPKETLTIGGIEYNKEDVENALKDLKPIK